MQICADVSFAHSFVKQSMRAFGLPILLAIFLVSFIACRKTWECKFELTGQGDVYFAVKGAKKHQAKEICADTDTIYRNNLVKPYYQCDLVR